MLVFASQNLTNLPDYEPQQAGFVFGIALVGAALFLAQLLLRPKKASNPLDDQRNGTVSTQGSFVPIVLGVRDVAPVVANDPSLHRTTTEESTGGGGKGGPDAPTQTIYHEKAVHLVCVGPGNVIGGIFDNGTNKLQSPISAVNTPSGSTVTLTDGSSFRVYWGLPNDPVDPFISQLWGIDTTFPFIVKIVWDSKRLGTSAFWGEILYRVGVKPYGTLLSNSSSWLTNGLPEPLLVQGVNPAYAIYQILTGTHPHGIGMAGRVDIDALEAVGEVCEDEFIPMNLLIDGGQDADAVIADICKTIGCMVVTCEDKVSFRMIRKVLSPPVLTNDMVTAPRTETEKVHLSEDLAERLVFEFADEDRNFRDGAVGAENDALTLSFRRPRTRFIEIAGITNRSVMSQRRNHLELAEFGSKEAGTLKGLRGLRDVKPNQVYAAGQIIDGMSNIRIISVQPSFEDASVVLEYAQDAYADGEVLDYVDPVYDEPESIELQQDTRWRAYEIPYKATPGSITGDPSGTAAAVAILRSRANAATAGANVYASLDGLQYSFIGTQPTSCVSGVLAEEWTPPAGADNNQGFKILANGPLITVDDNGSIDNALDLQSLPGWEEGRQMLLIDEHIMFVKYLEPEGDDYRCKDVIIARFDTKATTHAVGAEAFIIDRDKLNLFVHGSIIQKGKTVQFKVQPYGSSGTIPLSQLSAQALHITGKAVRPIAPPWTTWGGEGQNLRNRFYLSGDDITFEASYCINESSSTAMGEPLWGEEHVPASEIDGYLQVKIYVETDWPNGVYELVRTEQMTISSAAGSNLIGQFVYTSAMQATDGTDAFVNEFFESLDILEWYVEIRHVGSDGQISKPPITIIPIGSF